MKRLGLVTAGTLGPFVRFLASNGIESSSHLLKASISPYLIDQEDTWLAKQQVYAFLSDIAATYQIEALGLIVGDQICVADMGALGEQIYQCATLEKACIRFTELTAKFAEGNTATLEISGSSAWFTYQTTDHRKGNRDHADHYGMMMMLSIIRLVSKRWYPKEVKIQTGPCAAFLEHPGWKDTQVEFNAISTGFAFPSKWLSHPIPAEPNRIEITSEKKIYVSNPPETLVQTLEPILNAYLHIGGLPSLQNAANSLNMSERTLKRRLAEEGDTYSCLTDRIRIQGAKKLLTNSQISIKEIAYILGYSGSNNFIRAFRRIAGTSPEKFRRSVPRSLCDER